ncbi:LOW QUALITY PROTEIN: hypothetical protein V1477_002580 [Vespula maculifrons]|uniref:Uncharacterized protein n=1 Tax=Vespula maculifrons TaxID=7453 RepID=A0ABD2CV45_VESMC
MKNVARTVDAVATVLGKVDAGENKRASRDKALLEYFQLNYPWRVLTRLLLPSLLPSRQDERNIKPSQSSSRNTVKEEGRGSEEGNGGAAGEQEVPAEGSRQEVETRVLRDAALVTLSHQMANYSAGLWSPSSRVYDFTGFCGQTNANCHPTGLYTNRTPPSGPDKDNPGNSDNSLIFIFDSHSHESRMILNSETVENKPYSNIPTYLAFSPTCQRHIYHSPSNPVATARDSSIILRSPQNARFSLNIGPREEPVSG